MSGVGGAFGAGCDSFLDLVDTPADYTGQAGESVRVNPGETGLEFFTPGGGGVTDHGALTGLADDDHLQYLLLAGRAGGQSAVGGTAASETLTLAGSSAANRGTLALEGQVTLDYDWTTDIGSSAFTWAQTIPSSGAGLNTMFLVQNTITVDSSFFILAAIRDLSAIEYTVAPGFAASTLLLAQARYFTTTPGVAPAQSFIYAAQPTFESFGAGAVTCNGYRGLSASPILRARQAGDNLTMVNTYGMTFQMLWNTNNATAIIDAGNAAAVKVLNPQAVLFGGSAGTERCTNYYGIDYDNITLATTGERAVVHSSLVASAINYFLKNDGGASSEFGSGTAHFNDTTAIQFGGTLGGADCSLFWNATGFFEMFFWSTSDFLQWSSPSANRFLIEANDFGVSETAYSEVNFAFDRFTFGQSGAIGNQVGLFVAPARTVAVAGGWADFLLTQAGNLDINGLAMSDVSAWVVNSISLDALGGGSISDIATFRVGGMTTSLIGSADTAALYVTGRHTQRGTANYPEITAAALAADANDYGAQGTGNAMREVVRVSSDDLGVRTITGLAVQQTADTVVLINVGTVDNILLTHQDAASAASNRIITPTAATWTLAPSEFVKLWHDPVTDRWRILESNGA